MEVASRWLVLPCWFAVACAQAGVTEITLDTGFEDLQAGVVLDWDEYLAGAAGQGGWGNINAIANPQVPGGIEWASVNADQANARSGSKSLKTVADTRTLQKSLDVAAGAANPSNPTGGEWAWGAPFDIGHGQDWWVEAWVRVNPGGSAFLGLASGLGTCPLLQIDANGVPSTNGCAPGTTADASPLPDGWAGQWLRMQMFHLATPGNTTLELRVDGPQQISASITLPTYSGPGGGDPAYLALAGDAYWDDVRAGRGPLPIDPIDPVPAPALSWLLLAGLGLTVAARGRARLARPD